MARQLSLYLVRHAIAAERGEDYPDDDLRPLTREGVARFRAAVSGLARLDVAIDIVLTSPLVRARQTADILAKGLPDTPPIVETAALRPDGRLEDLLVAVSGHAGKGIALVGHEPHIGRTAARLMGARGALLFKKGAVCRIDFDEWPPEGHGVLRWFVTPKILRKAGR